MNKIKLQNVTKKYVSNKSEEFYAIKNISLIFKDRGFVTIVGKSGSGKSTILNMIAGLDKPSEGQVFFDNKNTLKFKSKDWQKYYKTKVGILFQNYNLLEDHSAIFNVMLPLLINGANKEKARKEAVKQLESVGLNSMLYNSKANQLSGGEKQRVALARTIINEPEVILCDEPTGALDSFNSINVMKCLKEYSKNHLVIMVSHNLQLTKEYSDRIIVIEEGKIKSDKQINDIDDGVVIKKKKDKKSSFWVNQISYFNFKKRFRRNLFSSSALLISLTSTFIAVGFINGKVDSINKASVKQFDFGSGTIAKEEVLNKGAVLSLTRTIRPELSELKNIQILEQNFDISPNFDAIFPAKMDVDYNGKTIDGVYFYPIYSFDKKHINNELLSQGSIPESNTLKQVVINQSCYELIKSQLHKEPINEKLFVNFSTSHYYVDFDDTYVVDNFDFMESVTILGVIDELSYLQTPKIYYSHVALESYLQDYILPNLSTYIGEDITWYDRILNAENFNVLSSYSYRLFLKDYHYSNLFFNSNFDIKNYSFSSTSITVRESLLSFMEVAEYGVMLFLGITLFGAILIMGIISFTSYSEDHKSSAILTCLGASIDQIIDIYLNESLLVGLVSTALSLVASLALSFGVNFLVSKLINLQSIIVIPISSFLGIPYLFPIMVFFASLALCAVVTIVPILFSKKISLKEELQSL